MPLEVLQVNAKDMLEDTSHNNIDPDHSGSSPTFTPNEPIDDMDEY